MFSTRSKELHASAAADQAHGLSEKALGTTKEIAAQAVDRVRALRTGAKGLASKSASSMSDVTARAGRHLGDYAHATGRYVSDQPVKAALIAAAVGAGITALLLAMRRNKRYYY